MINLEIEKSLKITPQETYDIISKAIDLANDEGFINQYVFERSLYIATLAVLDDSARDSIADAMAAGDSPLTVWYSLLEDGKIDSMIESYAAEIEYIHTEASIWYDDYVTYAASPRGMIESLEKLSDSFTKSMSSQVEALQNDPKINETLETANNLGMNNKKKNMANIDPSLFKA